MSAQDEWVGKAEADFKGATPGTPLWAHLTGRPRKADVTQLWNSRIPRGYCPGW